MLNNKIKISERKKIIDLVYEYTGHDFRRYSIGSLLHRLNKMYDELNFKNIDTLCMQIEKSEALREKILQILYIPTGEILRDPFAWTDLRKIVLKKLKKQNEINIFLPFCTSGEDLYSLRIVLDHADIGYKCNILAYAPTYAHKEFIISGIYSNKTRTSLEKNIEISDEGHRYNSYFEFNANDFHVNKNNFEDNLIIQVKKFDECELQSQFHLIIFRNRLLSFNKNLHFDALSSITKTIKKGGFLMTGTNEVLGATMGNKYKKVSKNEAIYKKTVF